MKQKIAQIYKRLIFSDFLFLEYNFCTVVLNLRQLSVSEIFFVFICNPCMAVGAVCYHCLPLEVRGFLLFSEKNRGNFLIFNFKREFSEQGYKSTKLPLLWWYISDTQIHWLCTSQK